MRQVISATVAPSDRPSAKARAGNARLLMIGALVVGLLATVGLGSAPAAAQVPSPGGPFPETAPSVPVSADGISGIVTSGGFPLPGATVAFIDPATNNVLATTTTGNDGRYLVSWLGAGTYAAYAVAPGNATPFWFEAGFADTTINTPTPITLTATQRSHDGVSFDLPTGGFGGSITGTTGPLANATATFTEVITGYSETAVVDPSGGFGLGYVPVGDYEVTVRWQGARAYRFPSTYTTGETGLSIALDVPTGAGATRATSPPTTPSRFLHPNESCPTAHEPIPHATVVAVDSSTGVEVAASLTDENGDYVIDGLLDASYRVYARAPASSVYSGGSANSPTRHPSPP